jgi:hypothetical protein
MCFSEHFATSGHPSDLYLEVRSLNLGWDTGYPGWGLSCSLSDAYQAYVGMVSQLGHNPASINFPADYSPVIVMVDTVRFDLLRPSLNIP